MVSSYRSKLIRLALTLDVFLGILMLVYLPFSLLLIINLPNALFTETYPANGGSVRSTVLIWTQPASFRRRPDYIALVAMQTRLNTGKLLSNAGGTVEVTNLTAVLLVCGAQDGASSCDAAIAPLDDLHRVGHGLRGLDTSVAGTTER